MNEDFLCRRRLLKRGAVTLISIVSIPILAMPRSARAGTAAKKDFHYQEYPNDGNRCSKCAAFNPSASQDPKAEGTCKIVAGPINPLGWCMAFSDRD